MSNYIKFSLYFTIFIFLIYPISAQTNDSINERPKVGLVLSGGGAKGFAHIEVLTAIEKAGIKIDYIGGTSMGAIIGSLYASGYSPDQIKKRIEGVDFIELFLQEKDRSFIPFFDKSYREKYILTLPFNDFKLTFPSAISQGQGPLSLLTNLLSNVHGINDYSKLPIPFLCIATNLETGEEEQMESGFLPLSVLASGAYPMLIEPVKIGDKVYIDGGIVNNFPARALRKKGMDIIIGVDLGSGLYNIDDLKSITNIISQIISYRINIKTDFEKDYVDLLIKPDLKKYGVTHFEKKDSILLKGKIAAEESYSKLVEIAKKQGNISISNPEKLYLDTNYYKKDIYINDLEIIGNKTNKNTYIKRKTGIIVPQYTSLEKLDKSVSALYSTGNYNKVYYQIINEDSDPNNKRIILNLDEKNNNSLKFGLHHDDVYKASILANLSLNKFLINNSTLSLDIIFSQNFRTYLNYYIDNGIFPSIGLNIRFNAFNNNFSNVKNTEYLIHRIRNFNQQIYLQSTILEKYALGAGIEYNYAVFSPYTSTNTKSIINKTEDYFINPYFYIKADTRNNANFPFTGFKLDASARYNLVSNADNKNYFSIKGDIGHSFKLTPKLAMENQAFLGISVEEPSVQNQYYLGGYFEQDFLNFKKFLGLPFTYKSGNQLISLYTSLNYRVLRNHYVKIYANFANLEDEFNDIRFLQYKYSSYGLGYGYDSPFGSINLTYTYSVNQNKYMFNIGLGYWF